MAARPATTRRATERPIEAQQRPAVRDFTGGAGFPIEWDVRPVYDFVFSLSDDAGSTDDLPAADRRWLTDARASLPQDLRSSVSRLFGSELAVHIASFVVERPEIRTARQFVEALEAATPAQIFEAVFIGALDKEDVAEPLRAVIGGDASRLPELEAKLPEWKREDRLAILRDMPGTAAEIKSVLRAWVETFAPIEDRIAAMLQRDYDGRAADRRNLRGSDLVERTTGGVRWLGEPGVGRVILAPSYFSRPYNFLLGGRDWRFFGYPVADDVVDGVDPLSPPQSLVRLHRALGDETRLRILKLLAGRDLYLTEIAQQLEFSKPTIKHHLAQLRAAGLTTVTESGTVMYYSLRRNRLDDASVELKAFLIDAPSLAAKAPPS
jgi:DNA-binding transcriptional ArsR family regulator